MLAETGFTYVGHCRYIGFCLFLKAEGFLVVADVAEGEEICINYVAFIHGTYLRRQKLQAGRQLCLEIHTRENSWNDIAAPPPPHPPQLL